MSKFYAVKVGRRPGIYRTWSETEALVKGFPGAKYKSFTRQSDAKNYINNGPEIIKTKSEIIKKEETRLKPSVKTELIKDGFINIYTDGSCVDKIGGYGFVNTRGYRDCGKVPSFPTTNQVAELYAIQEALKYIKTITINHSNHSENVCIYTDSMYSIGCLTKWCYGWMKNGWVNSKKEPVANQDLIKSILYLLESLKPVKIQFHHVESHKGNYYNEIADKLANEGRTK
jgi:ribonuclease HI